ncbi:MAG TPA: hypothetical protein VIV12_17635 [Streptosporangiaceae bacterium]
MFPLTWVSSEWLEFDTAYDRTRTVTVSTIDRHVDGYVAQARLENMTLVFRIPDPKL